MRIANLRIVFQVVFVLLFLACLYLMAAPRVQGYVVSVFLEADPLVALTTMLSTGHLYHVGLTGLWLGVGLLVVTILLGRVVLRLGLPLRRAPPPHALARLPASRRRSASTATATASSTS